MPSCRIDVPAFMPGHDLVLSRRNVRELEFPRLIGHGVVRMRHHQHLRVHPGMAAVALQVDQAHRSACRGKPPGSGREMAGCRWLRRPCGWCAARQSELFICKFRLPAPAKHAAHSGSASGRENAAARECPSPCRGRCSSKNTTVLATPVLRAQPPIAPDRASWPSSGSQICWSLMIAMLTQVWHRARTT